MNDSDHDSADVLTFYIDDDSPEDYADLLENSIIQLGNSREWLIGPPSFFRELIEVDEKEKGPDDVDFLMIGGDLDIVPTAGITKELDTAQFHEVNYVVEFLKKFSNDNQIQMVFELNGEVIGEINKGKISSSLAIGLLDEWEKNLGGPNNLA